MPLHFLDHDACCIHCGLDACDFPRGERLPPCPVWNEEQRAANVKSWQEQREPVWDEEDAFIASLQPDAPEKRHA